MHIDLKDEMFINFKIPYVLCNPWTQYIETKV